MKRPLQTPTIIRAKRAVSDQDRKIMDQLLRGNENSFSYLSFSGVLPVTYPDGTRVAYIPDMHAPAHNRQMLWGIKQFLLDFQPHIIKYIGDISDLFWLSRWPKPPRVVAHVQFEMDETRRLIDWLSEDLVCLVRVIVITGNHDDRFRRYLTDPASGISNLLDFQTREPLLSFHGLLGYKPDDPITFIYDLHERGGYGGGVLVNNDMQFRHGYIVRPKPGASPLADAERIGRSLVQGHTHRAGIRARQIGDRTLVAIELGHVVDTNHPYMGYSNLLNNWHPAIGVSTTAGGKLHLQVLPIKQVGGDNKYTLVYDGKVYRSTDR